MRFLIVEDDDDLRETLQMMLEAKFGATVVSVNCGNQAIERLKVDAAFDCVVCDYNMEPGTGGDVFRYVKEKHSAIPFLLCSTNSPDSYPEFAQQRPNANVLKPFSPQTLVQALQQCVGERALQKAAEKAPEYYGIRLGVVSRLRTPQFDLFVKLSDSKYVKIFRKGETFGIEELNRRSVQRVEHLYLKLEDLDAFLIFFLQKIERMHVHVKSHAEKGLEVSRFAMEVIDDLMRQFGVTPAVEKLIHSSVDFVIQALRKEVSIEKFLKQNILQAGSYVTDHSVIVAYISCAMATKIHWDNEVTFKKLAFASFLHDLTIKHPKLASFQSLNSLESNENISNFSYDDLESFRQHPHTAAEVCRKLKSIPPEVENIVLQHHEKPDGSGFPGNLTELQLHPLTVLFQIAHDLVFECFERGSPVDLNAFLEFRTGMYNSESYKIILSDLIKNN